MSLEKQLPSMVYSEYATLSSDKQKQFVEEFDRQKKSIGMAYLFLILVLTMHYGYLRKWGLQIAFWLTFGGLGFWWLADLFRTPSLVKNYNKDVSLDIMKSLKLITKS